MQTLGFAFNYISIVSVQSGPLARVLTFSHASTGSWLERLRLAYLIFLAGLTIVTVVTAALWLVTGLLGLPLP